MPSDNRTVIARIASHAMWAHCNDPAAHTLPAREAFLYRFEVEVDPDGALPPAERARRAEHARKAYFLRLALKSANARKAKAAARRGGATA